MLSRRQKKEMLQDGLSSQRRQAFATQKNIPSGHSRNLDELIRFIDQIRRLSDPNPSVRHGSGGRSSQL